MDGKSMATPSQRQGLSREDRSGGSPMAKPGADVQEGDIRLSSGDEAAIDADVPWMWNRVNHTEGLAKAYVLIRGELPAWHPDLKPSMKLVGER